MLFWSNVFLKICILFVEKFILLHFLMKQHFTNDINGGEGGGYNQHLLVNKHHILP